jgi:ribosome biogenesis GTPase A
MHKAAREMREVLPGVDVVVELLDARLPFSSANPMLAEICAGRPVIRLLMKCDLADPARTGSWLDWYRIRHQGEVRAVSMEKQAGIRQVAQLCRDCLPDRRGPVVSMVAGIPNVGKSTLINLLAGRAVANTGDEPAVTRRQQRIRIGHEVVLLDTPGVLWPNLENPQGGFRLAATGAIRQTALSHLDVAVYLAGFLVRDLPQCLVSRYGVEDTESGPENILQAIGRRRGCLVAGGKVDMDRAARILLNDFRSGALGRITLETPSMIETEMEAVALEREEKARRKAERKARRR